MQIYSPIQAGQVYTPPGNMQGMGYLNLIRKMVQQQLLQQRLGGTR